MFPLFETTGLIGLGLIGGSLARAIKQNGLTKNVIGYTNSTTSCQTALELGIIDQIAPSIQELVRNSDLLVIATPLSSYDSILQDIALAQFIKKPIITDVGSLKSPVIAAANKYLPTEILKQFVPAHPIAGTEKTGVESGFAELFQNKRIIITPLEGSNPVTIDKIKLLWESCGGHVKTMDSADHDKIYAEVSHAPQFIAYCYATLLLKNNLIITANNHLKDHADFWKFSRICASDPTIWIDIFMLNKINLFIALDNFIAAIHSIINLNSSNKLSNTDIMDAHILTQIIPTTISQALIKCSLNATYAGSGFADFTSYKSINEEHNDKSYKLINDLLFTIEQLTTLLKNNEREPAIDFMEKSVGYYKALKG